MVFNLQSFTFLLFAEYCIKRNCQITSRKIRIKNINMNDDIGDHQEHNMGNADIHNNSSDFPNHTTNSSNSTSNNNTHQQQLNVPAKMLEHFKAHKVDGAMWALRILTIFFSLGYVLPIFITQKSAFNKALLSNAAISALRLHQRLPAFTLTREFLGRLFVEDSCHYLIYSLIFFNVQPTFLILMPVTLFAILHASSYSLKLLDIIGQNSWWGARFLISLVEFQATNILKVAAFSEIFLMPLAVILTFTGRAGFVTPIVYYHFLVMRYSSRRNPHTRNAFTVLRMATEILAQRSPLTISKLLHAGINFVNRLAPQPQLVTGGSPGATQ